MGIHRLLHSSCCFLNTNTVTTRQLIGTATTVEAECWQVCGEAWVRGQRKMSQVLGVFGPLDFTMLRAVLAWRSFLNLWTRYFFNIPNFFSGRCQPQIRRSTCILTALRDWRRGVESRQGNVMFLSSCMSRQFLRPIHSPIQCLRRFLPASKAASVWSYQTPPPVKNDRSYNPAPPLRLHDMGVNNFSFYLYLIQQIANPSSRAV